MKSEVTNTTNRLRFQQLLDGQVVLGILRDHVFSSWETLNQPSDLRIERYWPGRDETFSIEWSFCLAQGQRCSLYGHALPEGVSPQLLKPTCDGPVLKNQALLGVSVYVDDWHLTIHSPDCDTHLDHLGTCLSDAAPVVHNIRMTNNKAENCNGNGRHTPRATYSLMGYRAGRRAAMHCWLDQIDGSTEDLFCKMYRDDRGHKLIRRHGQISDQLHMMTHGQVRVPEPVRYDTQLRLAQFRWTKGQRMSMDSTNVDTQLPLVAKALAIFHKIELDGLKTFTHEDEWRIVHRWTSLMNTIAPKYQQQLETMSAMLREASPRNDKDSEATLHRDYYPAQLLIDGGQVTILDLDTIARGHRCVDLGNFLAHLLLESIVNNSQGDTWSIQCQSFIRSYIIHGGKCDQDALTYYLSSSLIRIGMVHALRQNGILVAGVLWDKAKQLLCDPQHTNERLTT